MNPAAAPGLVMLALPQQTDVSLELVHSEADDPVTPGGLDHLAVQVDDLEATRGELKAAGLDVGPVETPGGPDGPHTASLFDPDGYHLELVQWPPGHPVAMTRADFESAPTSNEDTTEGQPIVSAIRLDMTMSLDGFVAGPDDRIGQEMGRGGFRLFNWLDDREGPGPNGEVYAESVATGAIISGGGRSSWPAAGTATITTASRSWC